MNNCYRPKRSSLNCAMNDRSTSESGQSDGNEKLVQRANEILELAKPYL